MKRFRKSTPFCSCLSSWMKKLRPNRKEKRRKDLLLSLIHIYAQLAGGPAVDNGFYYDVELDHRISTEDFEQIGRAHV